MFEHNDQSWCAIPWKDGGRSRAGADCAGLAWLWQRDENGLKSGEPKPDCTITAEMLQTLFKSGEWKRGDLVFFRETGWRKRLHVATHLGEGKLLHILNGFESRIDNGTKLIERLGMKFIGVVAGSDSEKVCAALSVKGLGYAIVFELIIAILLALASRFLTPSGRKNGLYGDNALVTTSDPEIPLPDILGEVTLAGQLVYKNLPIGDGTTVATSSGWNEVIVFASGPVNGFDFYTSQFYQGLMINGVSWQDKKWHNGGNLWGMALNPPQTEAAAVDGAIAGDSNVPNITFYDGHHDITVPVDIRASYDRDFPVSGFAGCAYGVFRFINPTNFSSPNITCPVQGRLCRTYDSSGFTKTTVTNEAVGTGDGSTVRFKLANADILSLSSLTVSAVTLASVNLNYTVSTDLFTLNNHGLIAGRNVKFTSGSVPSPLVSGTTYYVVNPTINTFQVSATLGGSAINLTGSNGSTHVTTTDNLTVAPTVYTPLAPGNQTGNVFHLNATKGYVEFLTAPGSSLAVVATYIFYARAWTQNPADHIVYLLTEPGNGKGFAESKINWPAAVALQSYCNTNITIVDSLGTWTQPRFQTNYSIDQRKAIQDHIKAFLDACNSLLFNSNGQFIVQAKSAQSSVFSFNTSNIMVDDSGQSTFVAELTDRSQKPNRLHLFFNSSSMFNAQTETIAEDEYNESTRAARLGNGGVVEQNITVPACVNQQQAEYLANMVLRELLDSNYNYTWKTSIKGLALQPGDVVDVTHPSLPNLTKVLRISKIEQDDQDRFIFTADEYTPAAYS